MRLAFWFVIFLENCQLSHSQNDDASSCDTSLPAVFIDENAQVGVILLRLAVRQDEAVQIDFDRQRNFFTPKQTNAFDEALHFSPADGSNQKKCTYQANDATGGKSVCDLKLATTLHPEKIREKTGKSPAGTADANLVLTYKVTCYISGPASFPLELVITVEFTNEFPPVFKQKLYTSQFDIINLMKGFHVLSLEDQATDGDVGRDGGLNYAASNGTDLIGVERTEVVLQRNVILEDVAKDVNLYFKLTAFDRGVPPKRGDTIFVLKVLDVRRVQDAEEEEEGINADEDREVTTSKAAEDRTVKASENDGKDIIKTNNRDSASTNLQVLVGIAGGIAALLAAVLLLWCCVTRRARKDKKPEEPKADPALPRTPGDTSSSLTHEEASSGGESVSDKSETSEEADEV